MSWLWSTHSLKVDELKDIVTKYMSCHNSENNFDELLSPELFVNALHVHCTLFTLAVMTMSTRKELEAFTERINDYLINLHNDNSRKRNTQVLRSLLDCCLPRPSTAPLTSWVSMPNICTYRHNMSPLIHSIKRMTHFRTFRICSMKVSGWLADVHQFPCLCSILGPRTDTNM